MVFFERFTLLCEENGTSVNAVAKELKMSSGSVTSWKNGTTPRFGTIKELADYFGVSTSFMTGESDDRTPKDKKNPPLNDLKEGVRQELIRRGKITKEKMLSEKDWEAILSVAETFANRSDE